MSATIKDIAQKLNISTSTVSYALNGGPRPVPPAVKEEVLRVARELKYRPNRLAKSLVTRRSHTVGILPTLAAPNLAVSPYFQMAFNGVLNQAEIQGYDVLVFSRPQSTASKADDILSVLWDGRTDGTVLIAPYVDAPVIPALLQLGVPFTVVNSRVEGAVCVTCDNRHGVESALNHLVGLGHTKIGHLAGPDVLEDARVRQAAFEDFMRDSGLELRPEWIVKTEYTSESAEQEAHALLDTKDRPTAVFCGNDEAALGLLRAARARGIRMPDELSVVGFDNIFNCEHMHPPLTTVEQPIGEMGKAAFEALIDLIEGRPAQTVVMETRLVVRESTAPPARRA
ncbi:MAG: LacI family DNA-binding transcriptional regulator [Fimbriimonadaceae bacterium]|nr:LacI family DNA-binding transcriptional regulator [Fimbriimonadaceae bacterium]